MHPLVAPARLNMESTFLPLLAYAAHEIDPGMDSSRDEGEERLRRVRALLRISARTCVLARSPTVQIHRWNCAADAAPPALAPTLHTDS